MTKKSRFLQVPIEPFIVDFCCPACRLIVEIDGDTHDGAVERDAARTARLERRGYRVVRFTNRDVHENLDGVLDAILSAVQSTAPSPLPSPPEGGEGIR